MTRANNPTNEPEARPLVFDVLPSGGRGRILRFGLEKIPKSEKRQIAKPDKKFVQAEKSLWLKICQGAGPAVYFIGLVGLIFFLRHTLAAFDDKTAKVDFYANTVRADGAGDWQGIDRALGQPEVFPDGGKDSFTAENSTAYLGGGQSLICENFTTKDFLMTTVGLPENPVDAPGQAQEPEAAIESGSASETPVTDGDHPIQLETQAPPEVQAGGEAQEPTENITEPSVPSASQPEAENIIVPAASESEEPVSAEPAVENHLPSNEAASEVPAADAVEPAESVSAPAADSQSVESAPSEPAAPAASAEGGEVSFRSALDRIFSEFAIKSAAAQEDMGADDRDAIFGRFRSAVIRMSLASFDQSLNQAILENIQPAAPVAAVETSTSEDIQETASSSVDSAAAESSSSAVIAVPLAAPTSSEPIGFLDRVLNIFSVKKAQAQSEMPVAKIVVWYSLSGGEWTELTAFSSGDLSNYENGGYLSFEAPFIQAWQDIDNLRLKFEGRSAAGDDFAFYLDSVWVEAEYQPAPKKNDRVEAGNPDEVEVDGQKIAFNYTDENSNENFIIKTDRKDYFGLANATVYFNVTNVGFREEGLNLKFYFPRGAGEVSHLEKLELDVPYAAESPHYSSKVLECANGWEKREGYYQCYPSEVKQACDLVSPNRRYCRIDRLEDGVVTEIKYHNRWSEVPLTEKYSTSTSGFFQRFLSLAPETKEVSDDFEVDKATHDGAALIRPGETKYFKMDIAFLPNSEGEFYIEALGDAAGYGLLDPWWSSGWSFRIPITIDNRSNASALTDYQAYIQISSTTKEFWRNVRSDGNDIRFVNSTETAELDHWVQYLNYSASSTRIWVKVPSVPAASTTKIFLYYGNSSAANTSNQYAPFSYSSVQDLYRVVSAATSTHIQVVSMIDGNSVQVDGGSAVALDRQNVTTFNVYTASSTIKAKGPIGVKLSGGAATAPAVPVSFAGTSFTVPASRDLEIYNVMPILADATSTIYDGLVNENRQLILNGHSRTINSDIATGSPAMIEATNPVLVSLTTGGPGDGLAVYPSSNEDLYGVKSQYNIISATADSSFDILCSSRASSSVSSLARGSNQDNTVCSGAAEGTGEAVRLNVKSGRIGAIQQDDSDGRQATMFLPFRELSSEYMVPTDADYIAVVCAPETANITLSIYDFSNVFVSSTTCAGLSGRYPGKAYFGSADTVSYAAGSRIVSNGGQPFYAYYEDDEAAGLALGGDETNLWGAVQGRKYAYPAPIYSLGVHEIKGPPTGAFNSALQSGDGSGNVRVSIEIDDITNDDSRAKIEYYADANCHGSPLDPTLSELDADTSADYGDPKVNNKDAYQIGTSTGWIKTASGTNTVLFNWPSKTNLPSADGTYCLRLTANDQLSDQAASATTSLNVDNVKPTAPGNLAVHKKTGASVTFNLPATSTESHFQEYKIFYKVYDGAPVGESDTLWGSSSDANLANQDFNHATSTAIYGLTAGLRYTFNLWAYDNYGNKASATSEITLAVNDPPTGLINSAALAMDGSGKVSLSIEADDANDDNTLRAKLEYSAGSACDFSSTATATLDASGVSSDHGTVVIDNSEDYRLGSSSGWIITSPGSNTVNFRWLSKTDLPAGDGDYCLRLTVNDGLDDQAAPATRVMRIDNVAPTVPGNLLIGSSAYNSLRLVLPVAQASADNNPPPEDDYRVFYRAGTSGVTEGDSEHNDTAFDFYSFAGATSTLVAGLSSGQNYVFNIWAYDFYGNKSSGTEVYGTTDSAVANKGLSFIDSQTSGLETSIAVADGVRRATFRATVQNSAGYETFDSVILRLANANDNSAPFDDLRFKWNRAGDAFSEIGADASSMASISPSSSSDCSGTVCRLDFKIIFNKSFSATSTLYSGQLYSSDTGGPANTDEDTYQNLFQVKKSWLEQLHYRWRKDNGGG